MIAWKSCALAAMKISYKQRRSWRNKHLVHISATGLVMHQRVERDDPKCPLCRTTVEDTNHLIICDGSEMEETFTTSMEKVQTWIRKTDR